MSPHMSTAIGHRGMGVPGRSLPCLTGCKEPRRPFSSSSDGGRAVIDCPADDVSANENREAPVGLAILGATGTIGHNTLDVVGRHPERFRIEALTAHRNSEAMAELCRRHRPRLAVMADETAARVLAEAVSDLGVEVLGGPRALETAASLSEVKLVMAGIVGAAGLPAGLAAARAGKRILLANKEALVMAGPLFLDTVRRHGAAILPVDSEHNAIFQCLPPDFSGDLDAAGVERLLLTGSGGPFRTTPIPALAEVTPDQACAHPNWVMGRKISVDSATMMNKGLEVIEACRLFGARPEQIQVVIHPQSVIHSMVSYRDGSVVAQLGRPDMRTPIAHVLGWPERVDSGVAPLDPFTLAQLTFERPNFERFPCLRLAFDALHAGGTACTTLNAANEVAVAAFLAQRIRFTGIARVAAEVLEAEPAQPGLALDEILDADARARQRAAEWVARLS